MNIDTDLTALLTSLRSAHWATRDGERIASYPEEVVREMVARVERVRAKAQRVTRETA